MKDALKYDYNELTNQLTNINNLKDTNFNILKEMLMTDEDKIISTIKFWRNEKLESANTSDEYRDLCNERIDNLKKLLIQKERLTCHLLKLNDANLEIPPESIKEDASLLLTFPEVMKNLREVLRAKPVDEDALSDIKDLLKHGYYMVVDKDGNKTEGSTMLDNAIDAKINEIKEQLAEDERSLAEIEKHKIELDKKNMEPLFNYGEEIQKKIKAYSDNPDVRKTATRDRSTANANAVNFLNQLFPKDENPFRVSDIYNFVTWLTLGCPKEEYHLYRQAGREDRVKLEENKIVPSTDTITNNPTFNDIPQEAKDILKNVIKEKGTLKGNLDTPSLRQALGTSKFGLGQLFKLCKQYVNELKAEPEKKEETSDPTGPASTGKQDENSNSQDTQPKVGEEKPKVEAQSPVMPDSSKETPSTEPEKPKELTDEQKAFLKKCLVDNKLSMNKTFKKIKNEKVTFMMALENKVIRAYWHSLEDQLNAELNPEEKAGETSPTENAETTTTTETVAESATGEEVTEPAQSGESTENEEEVPWKEGDDVTDPLLVDSETDGSNQNGKTSKIAPEIYVEEDIETVDPDLYEAVKDIKDKEQLLIVLRNLMKEGYWKKAINTLYKIAFHKKQIEEMKDWDKTKLDHWYTENVVKIPVETSEKEEPLKDGPGPKLSSNVEQTNDNLEKIRKAGLKDDYHNALRAYFKEKGDAKTGVPQSAKAAVVKSIKDSERQAYTHKYVNNKDGDIFKMLVNMERECFPSAEQFNKKK